METIVSRQPINSCEKSPSNHLHRQLGLYSLAAAAAGVGIVALATPAASEVVVTQKTIPIPMSSWGRDGVGISFANNGVDDLKLILSSYGGFGSTFKSLKVVDGGAGKGIMIGSSFPRYGLALAPGAKIGPTRNFQSARCGGSHSCYSAVRLARLFYGTSSAAALGPWGGGHKTAYLGVKFVSNGQMHYGWVRLTVNMAKGHKPSAAVTAYGYETEAGRSILAGATHGSTAETQVPASSESQSGPSLGMLAYGAEALPMWRREDTLASR
jgi:hypothetical protein